MSAPYAPALSSQRGGEIYSGGLAIFDGEVAVARILPSIGSLIVGYDLYPRLSRGSSRDAPGIDPVVGLIFIYGNPS